MDAHSVRADFASVKGIVAVEKLWMIGEFPVDVTTMKINFSVARETLCCAGLRAFEFRTALRLSRIFLRVQSSRSLQTTEYAAVNIPVQRFEESIAGRAYLFEVSAVETNRFRASIVKAPGVPTALMPFYGPTADAAICSLRDWLTRAYQRAANSRHS